MAVLSTPTVVSHDSASFRMFVATPLSSVASHDIALTDDEHVFSTAFKTSRCESQSCVGLTYSSEPSASDVHSNAPLKTVVVGVVVRVVEVVAEVVCVVDVVGVVVTEVVAVVVMLTPLGPGRLPQPQP